MSENGPALERARAGDREAAATALRDHVAVQGDKFHHLMASLKPAAE